jgi:hypothetical protein
LVEPSTSITASENRKMKFPSVEVASSEAVDLSAHVTQQMRMMGT